MCHSIQDVSDRLPYLARSPYTLKLSYLTFFHPLLKFKKIIHYLYYTHYVISNYETFLKKIIVGVSTPGGPWTDE
jgi:hypothetical protein